MLLNHKPLYYILGSQLNNHIFINKQQISLLIYSFIVGPIRFPLNILFDAKILRYNHQNKYIKYIKYINN
jgi:hypothetical protein